MNGSDSKSGPPEYAPLVAHVEVDDEATYVAKPEQLSTNTFASPGTDAASARHSSMALRMPFEDEHEEATVLDARPDELWDRRPMGDAEQHAVTRDDGDEEEQTNLLSADTMNSGAMSVETMDSGDFTDASEVPRTEDIIAAADIDDVVDMVNRPRDSSKPDRKSRYLPSLAPRGANKPAPDAPGFPGQESQEAQRDPLLGAVLLERYQVLQRIGVGGMSMVYRGRHATIGKDVAIKVLSPQLAEWPMYVEGFLQEARAASMLRHPNVVAITDFGYTEIGNLPFFVMEYLEGEDLRDRLDRVGRMNWADARAIVLQMCSALDSAHRRGVVHRDIKPENCYLLAQDDDIELVKLLDFGIAKVTSDTDPGSLTAHGVVLGTVEYISPERANKQHVDARADIYSLGVLLYRMMTGRTPFYGEPVAVVTAHVYDTPPPPRQVAPDAEIAPELDAIILKTLAKRPGDRYQTVAELVAALQAVPVPGMELPSMAGVGRARTMPPFMTNLASGASIHPAPSMYSYYPAPATGSRSKWIVGMVLALLLLLIIIWSVIESSDESSPPDGRQLAPTPATLGWTDHESQERYELAIATTQTPYRRQGTRGPGHPRRRGHRQGR